MKKGIIIILAATITAICFGTYRSRAPGRALMRLLKGDKTVQVIRLEFDTAGHLTTLDDQPSVAYFTSALATAKSDGYIGRSGGVLSKARIWLRDIGVADVRVFVTPDQGGIELSPDGGFDDPTYYWIDFVEPVPEAFRKCVREIRVASG